jgi:hypothetical protein
MHPELIHSSRQPSRSRTRNVTIGAIDRCCCCWRVSSHSWNAARLSASGAGRAAGARVSRTAADSLSSRMRKDVRSFGGGRSMTFVKRIAGATALGAAVLLSLSLAPAQAGYVVTLQEVGNDVVATGSGPIDLAGLHFDRIASSSALIGPAFGRIVTGPSGSEAGASVLLYSGPIGPTSFGAGGTTVPNSSSGNPAGILADPGEIVVPQGYVSNDPLSDTSTYTGKTFSTLGVTPGTYEWTWGPELHAHHWYPCRCP